MFLKAGFPLPLIRSGLVYDYPKLGKNIQTDVLIIGGGISGALTAYSLVKSGIGCIVADARSIGLGSTCASTSLLQYEIDVPLVRLQRLIGNKKAVRAYLLCRDAIGKLFSVADDIGFGDIQKRKSLYYAAAKKDTAFLHQECQARRDQGFDVRYLDTDEVKKIAGIQAPAAILSGEAAQTDSYLFTHALHQHSLKRGAQVFDRTEITGIEHKTRSVRAVTANGYVIRARKLVYATGYEVIKYIDKPIVKLASTYAVASEILSSDQPPWPGRMLLWNTADPYLYLRTTTDNRIIIGGRDEPYSSARSRDQLISKKRNRLVADFAKLFPSKSFIPEFSWTGTFGSTRDGLPYIGPYHKLPNSFFALGFGGNGITFSMIAAEMAAAYMKNVRAPKDSPIFSFER